jgi:SAM-dependent methyltransferase
VNDIYNRKRGQNFFDNLIVDVGKLYKEYPFDRKVDAKPKSVPLAQSPFHRIYRNRFIPLKYRRYFYRGARQINLDLTWFQEFRSYWSLVLHGRPLWGVQDFYFLRNLYRVKFQDNQVPDTEDPFMHLEAWQQPELTYQLFHQVFKESIGDEIGVLQQLFKYRKNARLLLEFGCATAPITTSLFEFYQPNESRIVYISDIQTLAFHYATYKVRHCANVKPILLAPENNFFPSLNEPIDAVFCMGVFEHLSKPLEIAKLFHQLLAPGGLLLFDYIKGEGEGLDTLAGVRERSGVLDYISENFDILQGTVSKNKSMGMTVAKKR